MDKTAGVWPIKIVSNIRSGDFSTQTEMSMAPTAAAAEGRTTTGEDDAACLEITGPGRHIHHRAYACWDSEETRHFYEDVLEMPLTATVVIEDPLRTDGSGYFYRLGKRAD